MRPVLTLCWKEWRVALDTPLGYVVATAFLLASGFFFGKNLFLFGQTEMRGYFAALPLLLMFFVPAMSMRMLADEQHDGSFELLATLPVTTAQIVAGKFLGVLLQVVVLLGCTLVYPASLLLLGHLDVGQVLASYAAALMLGAVYAAACLYASSLTAHAIIAYVIGFGLLLAFYLLTVAAPTLPIAMQDMLSMLSPVQHYQNMLRGVITLDDAVLMVSLAALFAGLTWFQLERRRWR
ncbi:MAG TPA: ABC transporter permease [Mariprofundaceae bacterium]|nr:ABC transporter permease [Mariprofundaceae bacterium]